MRKKVTDRPWSEPAAPEPAWLDLQSLARVELTSEDPQHPIESALSSPGGPGWRAAGPGSQAIRVLFDAPQRLRRVALRFEEHDRARTQEFVLRWSPDGEAFREVLRQQYGFAPPGTTTQLEDYAVDLYGVRGLELEIVPDISEGTAVASLTRWAVA
jgi:hypothetical protein